MVCEVSALCVLTPREGSVGPAVTSGCAQLLLLRGFRAVQMLVLF